MCKPLYENEIAAHVDADDSHEAFQNNIITILIGAMAFVLILGDFTQRNNWC